MKDRRNRVRRHIQAAQKWLGQAEHNLAEENDVRGDLNIMLASAELQRVNEKSFVAYGRRLAMRYAPPLVASILAALILLPNVNFYGSATDERIYDGKSAVHSAHSANSKPSAVSEMSSSLSVPTVSSSTDNDIAAVNQEIVSDVPDSPPVAVGENTIIGDYSASMQITQPTEEKSATESATELSETSLAEAPTVKLPDLQMQKLMQSAGKVLRSE